MSDDTRPRQSWTIDGVSVTDKKEITITLTQPSLDVLRDLADLTGVSVAEITIDALELSMKQLRDIRDALAASAGVSTRAAELRDKLRGGGS